jgi:hypothetical protein
MALATLGDLKTRIADYLARPIDDISAEFSAAIEMVESELNADPDFRVAEMETVATLPVTGGVAALPSDFLELRNVVDSSGSSCGSYYLSGLSLVFPSSNPNDGSITSVTVLYYSALPPLVKDTDTNWLLLKYPQIYLYGILSELGFWLVDATQISAFGQKFLASLEKLRSADRSKRWGGSAIVLNGPTP